MNVKFEEFLYRKNRLADYPHKLGELVYPLHELNLIKATYFFKPILSQCIGDEWCFWYSLEEQWLKELDE